MKKILSVILAAMLLLGAVFLTACGKDNDVTTTKATTSAASTSMAGTDKATTDDMMSATEDSLSSDMAENSGKVSDSSTSAAR